MNNNNNNKERQDVIDLILHFKAQKMAFRTMTPLINELGFRSLTGRIFDPSVLNKIYKNQNEYLNYNPSYRKLEFDLRKVLQSIPYIVLKVASNGHYVIRNERLNTVIFRSENSQEAFEKYKEIQKELQK